jgi:hypothetical protein
MGVPKTFLINHKTNYQMTEVFYCAFYITGFPFVTITEEEAIAWVGEDPDSRYYTRLKVQQIELPESQF